jgi:DNA-binding MarR family transcriptional regulator
MVTSGTMTNRLDRLEAQALIERRPNPVDGRGSVVALSAQGFDLIDQVIAEHVENQHIIMSGLTTGSREQLDGLLTLWLSKLEKADLQRNSKKMK